MRTWTVYPCRVLFVAALIPLVVIATPAWPQTALEPQSLVGEWRGSWTDKHGAKVTGQYYLTIRKVKGSKVHGTAEFFGHRKNKTSVKFVGTLSGNRLTFGRSTTTELVIDGNQMRGSSQYPDRDISLTRNE